MMCKFMKYSILKNFEIKYIEICEGLLKWIESSKREAEHKLVYSSLQLPAHTLPECLPRA